MKTLITETHKQQAISAIQRLVNIPSYLQESVPGAPFGQSILEALKECLTLFQEEGFETFIDPEGYYGYAEIGEGDEIFGVLCHLDVVPAGDLSNWETPPFEVTIKNDHLVGRGVQDDKGPSMAALFAVKALMDADITYTKRFRFIFGTDEETLWRCMNRYNQLEEVETMGFAPDSSFPLTYAEKGLL